MKTVASMWFSVMSFCSGCKTEAETKFWRFFTPQREQQTIHYTQVLYSAFNEESKEPADFRGGALPVKALCELKHAQAMIRMLKGGVRNIEALLDEAEAAGCHLYLHYVGEKDEYPILAKDVTITIDE